MIRKKFKNLIYFAILLLPLFLILGRVNIFHPLKQKIIQVTTSCAQFFSQPFKEVGKIFSYRRTFIAYTEQKKKIDFLQKKMIAWQEIELENKRLVGLLGLKRQFVYPSVAANVIGREPSSWHASLIINRGQKDGLKIGQAVVHTQGIVGKVTEIYPHSAKVMLLTDHQFSVACVVQRSRESAIVSGTLKGTCQLKYFNEQADIRTGDTVLTSKASSSFPEGLLIGEVIKDESTLSHAYPYGIRPAVSLTQVEEVLVVLK